MRSILIISAVCIQLCWTYGNQGGSNGVGSYAYQDTSGNRYGGTYQLKDGQVYGDPGNTGPVPEPPRGFQDLDDFFPAYFRNFENLLQEGFQNQLQHQKIALDASRKAFELTSNRAGYNPDFAPRFPFGGFPGFPGNPGFPGFADFSDPAFSMPGFNMNMGPNSAYAGAAVGPGYSHHIAAINPMNPQMPNIAVSNFADIRSPGQPQYYGVSSSSFSSSSNINGKQMNKQGSETVVNDNGKITKYKVAN